MENCSAKMANWPMHENMIVSRWLIGFVRVVKFSKICLPAKIQPADHISIEVVYSLAPKRTSGGRYL